jgi:predicted AlkP superfamily pyrophosphatase or phosphodiesterase
MDDGTKTIFSLFDEGPTGLASQTADTSFHHPGRGPGNCINCLIDAYRLSSHRRYLAKAEELIQRCIHPCDDIQSLNLDDPEYRWSYLVFLQILGKYIDYKEERSEINYAFFYARDSLLHYADWMVNNEVPYKEVLHKVQIPTETWPAHDIRKCHIFHLAAKYGQEKA